MLRSMTGFGRCLVENSGTTQQWEIKSVNSRYLDLKWRLPPFARYLESSLEKIVRRHASRGRIEISLVLQFASGAAPWQSFDMQGAAFMLDSLLALAKERGDEFKIDYSPLLTVPALWNDNQADIDENLASQLTGGLSIALEDWNESRTAEGNSLAKDLLARIMRMEEWTEILSERAPEIREERLNALRERLETNLATCNVKLDEDRLLQEVVILTDKMDVSEELTRLFSHLERLQHLLRLGEDAGRRLDFTLQECFREINTFGNKLTDAQLSRVVVDFKNELEKCREQVQNLE